MRRLAVLSALIFAVACNDSTVMQPDGNLSLSAEATSPVLVTMVCRTVEEIVPQEIRTTPGGVIMVTGGTSRTECDGDMEGSGISSPDGPPIIINPYTGRGVGNSGGPSNTSLLWTAFFGQPITGYWYCHGHYTIAFIPEYVQWQSLTCTGGGFFDGMKMKATGSNELDPGLGLFKEYVFHGEIR